MIELKVEPYCQDCPEFEAKSIRQIFQYFGDINVKANTVIYCAHRDRCWGIVDHIKTKASEPSAN